MKTLCALALFVAALGGCPTQQVKVQPLKVEPIHITVDVNVRDPDPAAKPDDASP